MAASLTFTCTNTEKDIPYMEELAEYCLHNGVNIDMEQQGERTKYRLVPTNVVAHMAVINLRNYLARYF